MKVSFTVDQLNYEFWHTRAVYEALQIQSNAKDKDRDFENDILMDTWTLNAPGRLTNIQQLRCYTIEEMDELLAKSDLMALDYIPAGRLDFEKETFTMDADLSNCMTYYIRIKKD